MNSKNFILYLIVVLISLNFLFDNSNNRIIKNKSVNTNNEKIDSNVTVTFSAVGDLMCHSTQFNYAWVKDDSFDFNGVYSEIRNYLSNKDILIGNLETVLAGNTKNYLGYPFFNTPNQFADALKKAGFDFLTTANNHADDQGYDGVARTIDYLRKINIIHLGTKKLDNSKNYNFFVRKGLRFGILAYTYGTNANGISNPKDVVKYVNIIDTLKIKNDISNLRSQKADFILVYLHFGQQYQQKVTKYQRKIVSKIIEYGADAILGAHPHIIQQFEKYHSKKSNVDSGLVVFSLGNFVSNQRWRYSDGGVVFNFNVTKNIFTDSIYISDINFLPVWVFKGITENGKEYKILPASSFSDSSYKFLTEADRDSMKNSFYDTIDLITKKNNLLKLDSFN